MAEKSPSETVEGVFIYPRASPRNSLVPEADISIYKTSGRNSSLPIFSLVLLICGWTPLLAMSLYMYLSKQALERVKVEVVMVIPILILSAVRPHLEGKCKLRDIKKMLKSCQDKRKLEEKNINQMIHLASVPVGLLTTENHRGSEKYSRKTKKL